MALDLVPMEGGAVFDLVQDRNGERRLFEGCGVKGFELRFCRGKTVHLKLEQSAALCAGMRRGKERSVYRPVMRSSTCFYPFSIFHFFISSSANFINCITSVSLSIVFP